MVCYLARAFDYRFDEVQLTASELKAVADLPKTVGGYLAWRRTLVAPCALLLCVATLIQIVLMFYTYKDGPTQFVRDLVGPTVWERVFCPVAPCNAAEGLEGVYYISLLTDVALAGVAVASCVLLIQSAGAWAAYGKSSKKLRWSYGAIFVAPFVLLLMLPPAQFINLGMTQQRLCEERIRELVPDTGATRSIQSTVCPQPIDEWASTLEASLIETGRLLNRSTGTCDLSERTLELAANAFERSGLPCEDDPIEFKRVAPGLGGCEAARLLHLCAAVDRSVNAAVISNCPLTCKICEPPPPCVDDDEQVKLAGRSSRLGVVETCAQVNASGWCNAQNADFRTAVRTICPKSCDACNTCSDNDRAIKLAGDLDGVGTCRKAAAEGLCTTRPAFYERVCPKSCAVCVPVSRRALHDAVHGRQLQNSQVAQASQFIDTLSTFGTPSQAQQQASLVRQDGCVDPITLTAIEVPMCHARAPCACAVRVRHASAPLRVHVHVHVYVGTRLPLIWRLPHTLPPSRQRRSSRSACRTRSSWVPSPCDAHPTSSKPFFQLRWGSPSAPARALPSPRSYCPRRACRRGWLAS